MKKPRRSQKPTENAVSGIGDLEREEQAVYPLPEPRRHVHRPAHTGRLGALPSG